MNFKETYEEDLCEVFFDTDELASEHSIDGQTVTVVLKEVSYTNAKQMSGRSLSAVNPKETAVNKSSTILYIREKDVTRKYTVNAMIDVDGRKLFVQDVCFSDGIYKLTIGGYAV